MTEIVETGYGAFECELTLTAAGWVMYVKQLSGHPLTNLDWHNQRRRFRRQLAKRGVDSRTVKVVVG